MIRLSNVQPSTPQYLWNGRIPIGHLTLLEGPPGASKSTVTYDLAARVSSGRPMPDAVCSSTPRNVLILQAEDDPSSTIRPKLEAMGADLKRVFVATRLDLDQLHALKPGLVILDPITSFLSSTSSDPGVRKVLDPIVQCGGRVGFALVGVRHFRKTGAANALYRGVGSIALTALARSVLQMGVDLRFPGKRVLAQAKSSLGAISPSLLLELDATGQAVKVKWCGPTDLAAEHLGEFGAHRPGPELKEAQFVLFSILADGALKVSQARSLCAEAGIAPRTLRRAKDSLGVRSRRRGFGPGSVFYWVLPGDNELVAVLRENELERLADQLFHGSLDDLGDADPAPRERRHEEDRDVR